MTTNNKFYENVQNLIWELDYYKDILSSREINEILFFCIGKAREFYISEVELLQFDQTNIPELVPTNTNGGTTITGKGVFGLYNNSIELAETESRCVVIYVYNTKDRFSAQLFIYQPTAIL